MDQGHYFLFSKLYLVLKGCLPPLLMPCSQADEVFPQLREVAGLLNVWGVTHQVLKKHKDLGLKTTATQTNKQKVAILPVHSVLNHLSSESLSQLARSWDSLGKVTGSSEVCVNILCIRLHKTVASQIFWTPSLMEVVIQKIWRAPSW